MLQSDTYLDAILKWMRQNNQTHLYVLTQLTGKAMAALAQLLTIYVFTKLYGPDDAAIIFMLLGYGIWIQVFELGFSQVIQNGLNTRVLNLRDVCSIIFFHYFLMLLVASLVLIYPGWLEPFHGQQSVLDTETGIAVFSVGIALMLVSTTNVLIQRMLLVVNRGIVANWLIFWQASFTIVVLFYLQWRSANLLESVAVFLAVPVITYAPLVLQCALKLLRRNTRHRLRMSWVFKKSLGFWGVTALASIYLGADYFFAAVYLSSAEVVAYHFVSRLFFISFVAYFAYVQHQARGISRATLFVTPHKVWSIMQRSVLVGGLSVIAVLLTALVLEWSGGMALIGASGLVSTSLILAAAVYYGTRVIRDVGLVLVWNMGEQRLLYGVHALEVALVLILLGAFASKWGSVGIFLSMALVAAVSATAVYAVVHKCSSCIAKVQS